MDSTSLVWKSYEEVTLSFFFFLQRNLISCLWKKKKKARIYLLFIALLPPFFFFFDCHPSFWIEHALWCCTSLCSGCSESSFVSEFLLASKALTKDVFKRFKLMTLSSARICVTLNFLGSVITKRCKVQLCKHKVFLKDFIRKANVFIYWAPKENGRVLKVLFRKSWLVKIPFNWVIIKKTELKHHMACDKDKWINCDEPELVTGLTGIRLDVIWPHVLVQHINPRISILGYLL